jgi:hypothetical protein
VKLTIELPAAVHRELTVYAEVFARETGQTVEPAKLIAPMLARFMASDRGYAKARLKAQKGDSTIALVAPQTSGVGKVASTKQTSFCKNI